MSDADTSPNPQAVLDGLNAALGDEQRLSPAGHALARRVFAEAVQRAVDHPRTPAEILAEWRDNVGGLQAQVEARRRSGELTATDAAELLRQFDGITEGLEYLHQRQAGGANAVEATQSGLPQGMPVELALALQRNRPQ